MFFHLLFKADYLVFIKLCHHLKWKRVQYVNSHQTNGSITQHLRNLVYFAVIMTLQFKTCLSPLLLLLLLLFCYYGCYYNLYTVKKCLSHLSFQIHVVVVFVTVVVIVVVVVVVVTTCWLLLQLIHCKQMPESLVVSNPCCCFCHCCCCYYNLFMVKTYLSHLLFQVHVCL